MYLFKHVNFLYCILISMPGLYTQGTITYLEHKHTQGTITYLEHKQIDKYLHPDLQVYMYIV